jgi:uncharacterized membrane protein
MNHSRWWLAVGAILLLFGLAYVLRDTIYQTIILPLDYLWWLIGFYYSLLPQMFLWVLLLAALFVFILFEFASPVRFSEPKVSKHSVKRGPVAELAGELMHADKGSYFKWHIANRLGVIARELGNISDWRNRSEVRDDTVLEEAAVEKYLDAGLNTSFVDYPGSAYPFEHRSPTVLDLNPEVAVDYLESFWENNSDRDS